MSPLASAPLGDDGQVEHDLSPSSVVSSSPVIDNAILTQEHSLTANDVVTGFTSLDSVDLDQEHLMGASLNSSSPILDAVELTQIHLLAGNDLATGPPSVLSLNMTEDESFLANPFSSGNPVLDNIILTQAHDIAVLNIETANPVIDTLTITTGSINNSFTANSIVASQPTLDQTTITQVHVIDLLDISSQSSVLDNIDLTQVHNLLASNIAASESVLDTIAISFTSHSFTGQDISSLEPVLDSTNVNQVHNILFANITGNSSIDAADLAQVHNISATSTTSSAPTVSSVSITQEHVFNADDISAGIPTINISSMTGSNQFAFNDISASTPILDQTDITQVHEISIQDISAGNIINGQPLLEQTNFVLIPQDIISNSSLVDSVTLSQEFVFETIDITTDLPILDSFALIQTNLLLAADILSSNPLIDNVELIQDFVFSPLDIFANNPIIDLQGLEQTNFAVSNDSISASPPLVGSPFPIQEYVFATDDISSSTPIFDTADLSQNHIITPLEIISSQPSIDVLDLFRNEQLSFDDITAGQAILGNSRNDYSQVIPNVFDTFDTYQMFFDTSSTATRNDLSPFYYIDENSISVSTNYVQFTGYGRYLAQSSYHHFIRWTVQLNFTGVAGNITANGNASYPVQNSQVQIPSSWKSPHDSNQYASLQSSFSNALSGNINFENWFSSQGVVVEAAPYDLKTFTIVDSSAAGTNYTSSSSSIKDSITITSSYNAIGRENSQFVFGNQWLVTGSTITVYEDGVGFGRATITRFDPASPQIVFDVLLETPPLPIGAVAGNPIIDDVAITQDHILGANDVIAGLPEIPTRQLGLGNYFLDASDVSASPPELVSPDFVRVIPNTDFQTNDISTQASEVDTVILQSQIRDFAFSPNNIAASTDIGSPTISSIHNLLTDDVVSGNPVIDIVTTDARFVFRPRETSKPVVGSPELSQIHNLSANDIVTFPPIIENLFDPATDVQFSLNDISSDSNVLPLVTLKSRGGSRTEIEVAPSINSATLIGDGRNSIIISGGL